MTDEPEERQRLTAAPKGDVVALIEEARIHRWNGEEIPHGPSISESFQYWVLLGKKLATALEASETARAALKDEREQMIQLVAFYSGEDLGGEKEPREVEWEQIASISPNERSHEQQWRLIALAQEILENCDPARLRSQLAIVTAERDALKRYISSIED